MKAFIERCVRDYSWIHTSIAVLGNILFVIGSVLFMQKQQDPGVWFFIGGSLGMLVGNVGNGIAMYVERQWRLAQEAREARQRSS